MKKIPLWVYRHPFSSGLIVGLLAAINLILTDLPVLAFSILLIFALIMMIGMWQNSQRYDALLRFAQSELPLLDSAIRMAFGDTPELEDLPEVGEVPQNLANDPNENYERSERIKLGLFYRSPLNDWISIGDGYRRKKTTAKRPVK